MAMSQSSKLRSVVGFDKAPPPHKLAFMLHYQVYSPSKSSVTKSYASYYDGTNLVGQSNA